MGMDDANWPLRATVDNVACSLESISQDEGPEELYVLSRPSTPQPPSIYSVHDYRSILATQTPFSEPFTDEFVFGESVDPQQSNESLYMPPRLAPRVRLPRLPAPFETQHFPPHAPLSLHITHSSPSLSSSVTTASSSSPASPETSSSAAWPFSEVTAQLEPLRTKRRFCSVRTAKRLPHRNSPPWEVHAIIQVCDTGALGIHQNGGDGRDDTQTLPGLDVEISVPDNLVTTGPAPELIGPPARYGKSCHIMMFDSTDKASPLSRSLVRGTQSTRIIDLWC